jgi:hypothetical protein
VVHSDNEANPVGSSIWKWLARVFDGDRVHESAILIGPDLGHHSLDCCHPIGVVEVDDRDGNAWVSSHIFGLPSGLGSANNDPVALKSDPYNVISWRAIGSKCREVCVVGRLEQPSDFAGERALGCHLSNLFTSMPVDAKSSSGSLTWPFVVASDAWEGRRLDLRRSES